LKEAAVALTFIAKDPETGNDNCPTVWVDEDGSFLVQGWKIDDEATAECLRTGSIPDTEAVVRLPARMVDAMMEACGVVKERSAVS
jgi:hypothetical protein